MFKFTNFIHCIHTNLMNLRQQQQKKTFTLMKLANYYICFGLCLLPEHRFGVVLSQNILNLCKLNLLQY